ncbi:MAG: exodeoxyribonuclease VII large subunit, partial [Hydrogenoanaerobacterium sp.]
MLNGNLLTVSQLNRYVKALFEDNKQLSGLLLKGEISNLSNHFSSGHVYFSLKDEGASVKAIMFKTYAKELKFTPKNGQKVIVSCS